MGGNAASEITKDITVGPKQGPSKPKTSFKNVVGAESFDYGKALGTNMSLIASVPKENKPNRGDNLEDNYTNRTRANYGTKGITSHKQIDALAAQGIKFVNDGFGTIGYINDEGNFVPVSYSASRRVNVIGAGATDEDLQKIIDQMSGNNGQTTTETGNALSMAESTSADTLQSSQTGVKISDAAKQQASALGLELVNTDTIQGSSAADTLQKKQQALLEAERRQQIRRLIARNRRARFGGSRLLMSAARENPSVGIAQTQSSLSPRTNPRDTYG
tara:strand:- start:1361 stop:2185 length:825 start_codon:yes stop_codon:yes gene_type:complete